MSRSQVRSKQRRLTRFHVFVTVAAITVLCMALHAIIAYIGTQSETHRLIAERCGDFAKMGFAALLAMMGPRE